MEFLIILFYFVGEIYCVGDIKNLVNVVSCTKPYHIVIFTDESSKVDVHRRRLNRLIPSYVVDTTNKLFLSSINMQISKSSIYILFVTDKDDESYLLRILATIDYIAKFGPTRPRSNFLIILSSNRTFSKNLKQILIYAWTLKFLNLSVLRVTNEDDDSIDYLHYNPFNRQFYSDRYKSCADVFPNKLKNLYGYPLKTLNYVHHPFLKTAKHKNSVISELVDTAPVYNELLSKKLNFSIEYINSDVIDHRNFTFLYNELLLMLEKNQINLLPIPHPVNSNRIGRKVLMSEKLTSTGFVILAPIRSTTTFKLPYNFFISIVVILAIVIIFFFVIHFFKLSTKNWKLRRILSITLLGRSNYVPKTSTERLIFITFVWLGAKFSTDLFTSIMDVNMRFIEKQTLTYDDIFASKLPIYTDIQKIFIGYELDIIKKIISRSIHISFPSNCTDKLIKTKDVICILSSKEADMVLKEYGPYSADQQILEKIGSTFHESYLTAFFEQASPYLWEFDRLITILKQSKIEKVFQFKIEKNTKSVDRLKNFEISFNRQLYYVLFIGWILSAIVFAIEMFNGKFVTNKNIERKYCNYC